MLIQTHWDSCPSSGIPSLLGGQVHVWRAVFEHTPSNTVFYRSFLSPEELDRAVRFKNPSAQTQFLVTRGVLRQLLGRYMNVSPANLTFASTPEGKPYLQGPDSPPFQFNVTHTEGMALIAISKQEAVGIDVERLDRTVEVEGIAGRFFSEREANYLASIPEVQRKWWFLAFWTCKEAYLKMRGTGLGSDLRQWEIHFEKEGTTALVSGPSDMTIPSPCFLRPINPGKLFVAALAVESLSANIFFYDWVSETPVETPKNSL